MTVCKNCAHEFEGKFCPQCGQKAKTKRITTKQVYSEVRQRIFHYEQGFWYTTRELLLRPGHTIREYLEGKRVRHIKPLKFMFWAAAISFLIFHFIGLDQDMMQKMGEQQSSNPIGQKLSVKIFKLLSDHPAIMLFLMVPLIACFSWLLFRRSRYNYAEHFVLNTYLMGELSLASIVMGPVSKWLNSIFTSTLAVPMFSVGIWVIYFGWAYGQFFQPAPKIWIWLKGGFSILLGYLLMIICISIFITVMIIFFRPQLEAWLAN